MKKHLTSPRQMRWGSYGWINHTSQGDGLFGTSQYIFTSLWNLLRVAWASGVYFVICGLTTCCDPASLGDGNAKKIVQEHNMWFVSSFWELNKVSAGEGQTETWSPSISIPFKYSTVFSRSIWNDVAGFLEGPGLCQEHMVNKIPVDAQKITFRVETPDNELASSLQTKPWWLIITWRKSGHDISVTCHADRASIILTAKKNACWV